MKSDPLILAKHFGLLDPMYAQGIIVYEMGDKLIKKERETVSEYKKLNHDHTEEDTAAGL